jgi:uncharacterized protein YkwD
MKNSKLLFGFLIVAATSTFTACNHKMAPAAKNTDASSPATSNRFDAVTMQQDILANVNQYRVSIGLQPLQMLDAANMQAAKHSVNMAARRTPFGHTGFEARAAAISTALGVTVSAAAENVADGKLTAKQVVAGWLHSPGHKKNIQGNYSLTGIGCAVDEGGVIYFTQIFVRK